MERKRYFLKRGYSIIELGDGGMCKIDINCHSSIRIEGESVLYFDPYNIEQESHDADYIFLTHDHYDHFDPPSMQKIVKDSTKIIVPFQMKENVKEIDIPASQIKDVLPNNKYTIDSFYVETIPSYNINKPYHPKEKDWCGYILLFHGKRYYIPGDTDFISEMEDIFCDVLFLPIGGTYTMNAEEAALCANKIQPKEVIPIHYNSLVGTFEDALCFQKHLDSSIKCEIYIK